MKHVHLGTITLSLGILLSACGGGGGGGGLVNTAPPPSTTPANNQTAFSGTQTRDTSVVAQLGTRLLNIVRQSGNTIFGSVAQAFTDGLSGVTGIATTYNGSRFTLQINRQDGSSTTLDTTRDNVSDVVAISPSRNPVTNRNASEGYIYRLNGRQVTVAGVSVEWSRTAFTDYLAGGYWVHADLATQGAEVGAFIHGPDFEDAIQVPLTGTATYNGRAGGIYLSRYGTDDPHIPSGTVGQGEYAGRVRLTADFGSNRISGRIDNIGLYNNLAVTPDGRAGYNAALQNTDYEIILGAAPISRTGTFSGQGVTLTHPQLQITSSRGNWAGRFSSIDDGSGNPRAVAGTHRGYSTTAGGGEGVFTGAFYGATERFQ